MLGKRIGGSGGGGRGGDWSDSSSRVSVSGDGGDGGGNFGGNGDVVAVVLQVVVVVVRLVVMLGLMAMVLVMVVMVMVVVLVVMVMVVVLVVMVVVMIVALVLSMVVEVVVIKWLRTSRRHEGKLGAAQACRHKRIPVREDSKEFEIQQSARNILWLLVIESPIALEDENFLCLFQKDPSSNCTFPAKEDSPVLLLQRFGFLSISSQQQDDLRLSGLPSGQGAGVGARTRDRRVPADLREDSLATASKGPVEKCRRWKLCGTDPPPFGGYKASKSVSDDSRRVKTTCTDSEAAYVASVHHDESGDIMVTIIREVCQLYLAENPEKICPHYCGQEMSEKWSVLQQKGADDIRGDSK
ncbi:hypothetical protein PoB_004228200 [Plakobranchus ocellatus]|uniref:Uncharacterized protein n=1 Tax=Plakobranchus ocellatus TaxID=259542 RepID=A0AAV4B9B0_9GAST|nr:hypothetical protein PoB_004228200 [Plakobranchus ocellatus]